MCGAAHCCAASSAPNKRSAEIGGGSAPAIVGRFAAMLDGGANGDGAGGANGDGPAVTVGNAAAIGAGGSGAAGGWGMPIGIGRADGGGADAA